MPWTRGNHIQRRPLCTLIDIRLQWTPLTYCTGCKYGISAPCTALSAPRICIFRTYLVFSCSYIWRIKVWNFKVETFWRIFAFENCLHVGPVFVHESVPVPDIVGSQKLPLLYESVSIFSILGSVHNIDIRLAKHQRGRNCKSHARSMQGRSCRQVNCAGSSKNRRSKMSEDRRAEGWHR